MPSRSPKRMRPPLSSGWRASQRAKGLSPPPRQTSIALPSAEPSRSSRPSPFQSRASVGMKPRGRKVSKSNGNREGPIDPGFLLESARFAAAADLGAHVDRPLYEDLGELEQPDRDEHAQPLGTRRRRRDRRARRPRHHRAARTSGRAWRDRSRRRDCDTSGCGSSHSAGRRSHARRVDRRGRRRRDLERRNAPSRSCAPGLRTTSAAAQPPGRDRAGRSRLRAAGRCAARGDWSRRCPRGRRRRCRRRGAWARRSRVRVRSRRWSVRRAAGPGSWRDRRCAACRATRRRRRATTLRRVPAPAAALCPVPAARVASGRGRARPVARRRWEASRRAAFSSSAFDPRARGP